MNFQGKSKENYDASEFIAFVGVVGAGISILAYIIFLFLMIGCQAPEIPQPAKTPSYARSTTIQPQYNGGTIFPKYIPILK
jgi:hypothetical protein